MSELLTNTRRGIENYLPHTTHGLIKEEPQDDTYRSRSPQKRLQAPDHLTEDMRSVSIHDDNKVGILLVNWSLVAVEFYKDNKGTQEYVDSFPLHFLCAGSPHCNFFHIQTQMLKDELSSGKHKIHTDEWVLRLEGSDQKYGWEKKDMCTLAMLWERTKPDDLNMRLILVPVATTDRPAAANHTPEDDLHEFDPDSEMGDGIFTPDASLPGTSYNSSPTQTASPTQIASLTQTASPTTPKESIRLNSTRAQLATSKVGPSKRRRSEVSSDNEDCVPSASKKVRFVQVPQVISSIPNREHPSLSPSDAVMADAEPLLETGSDSESNSDSELERESEAELAQPEATQISPDANSELDTDDTDVTHQEEQEDSATTIKRIQAEDCDPAVTITDNLTIIDAEKLVWWQNEAKTIELKDIFTYTCDEGQITLDRYNDPSAETVDALRRLRDRSVAAKDGEFDRFCAFVAYDDGTCDDVSKTSDTEEVKIRVNPVHSHWTRDQITEIAWHCGFDDLVDFIRHPKWRVPQISKLFKEGKQPYFYQVVEAWHLILTTGKVSGAFEGSLMGLGKTWIATMVIVINIVLRSMREHLLMAEQMTKKNVSKLDDHHVCDDTGKNACPTRTSARDSTDGDIGWRWFRCPCEYRGSNYDAPIPGFGATLFLGQAANLELSIVEHLNAVLVHRGDRSIPKISLSKHWNGQFLLPKITIRTEFSPYTGQVEGDMEVVARAPKNWKEDGTKPDAPIEAPFDANGLIIVSSTESWSIRSPKWTGIILGLVIMDEAHLKRGRTTVPMLVHTVSRKYWQPQFRRFGNNAESHPMAHSKYIAMSGSVVDGNTAEVYTGYIELFYRISVREGRDWADDKTLANFIPENLKKVVNLYRKCQDEADRAKKATAREFNLAARQSRYLVESFIHRMDLDTRMWRCPVAVDNSWTAKIVVEYTQAQRELADKLFTKAFERVTRSQQKRNEKKKDGKQKTQQELNDAITDEVVRGESLANLGAWIPDIVDVTEVYAKVVAKKWAEENRQIATSDTDPTLIPWSKATSKARAQAVKPRWTVGHIEENKWWEPADLKSNKLNPFSLMLKRWVRSCPLLTTLRFTLFNYAFKHAAESKIERPQFLITCMEPMLAILVDQWLKKMVANRKCDRWYIGDGRDVSSVLWLSRNVPPKVRSETMDVFKKGMDECKETAPRIMVSSATIISTGHDLANISYHFIIGEDNQLSRWEQCAKRGVRPASEKAPGRVAYLVTGTLRDETVEKRRSKKTAYKKTVTKQWGVEIDSSNEGSSTDEGSDDNENEEV